MVFDEPPWGPLWDQVRGPKRRTPRQANAAEATQETRRVSRYDHSEWEALPP